MAIDIGGGGLGAVYLGDTLIAGGGGGGGGGKDFDFLLIGGGGGGGRVYCGAGGGGAGGAILKYGVNIFKGTYCINIGLGGCCQCNGQDSEAIGYIAYGGGAGASGCWPSICCIQGNSGGSGGGGTGFYSGGSCCGIGGAACNILYGSDGGIGVGLWGANNDNRTGGGGGGGAGGVGGNGWSTGCNLSAGRGGDGGKGIYTDISGEGARYAGGGGGWGCRKGCGGCGYDNCGGGGGWKTGTTSYIHSNPGIFILRYPTACNYNITGGCKYVCGDYTIHCFTSDGTLTIS